MSGRGRAHEGWQARSRGGGGSPLIASSLADSLVLASAWLAAQRSHHAMVLQAAWRGTSVRRATATLRVRLAVMQAALSHCDALYTVHFGRAMASKARGLVRKGLFVWPSESLRPLVPGAFQEWVQGVVSPRRAQLSREALAALQQVAGPAALRLQSASRGWAARRRFRSRRGQRCKAASCTTRGAVTTSADASTGTAISGASLAQLVVTLAGPRWQRADETIARRSGGRQRRRARLARGRQSTAAAQNSEAAVDCGATATGG